MEDKDLLNYFIKETNKRFDKVDQKLDQLLEFKWRVVGGAIVVSVILTLGFQMGVLLFH